MSGSSGAAGTADEIDLMRYAFIKKPFPIDDLARKVREV
jgi:hypothetical protein